MSTGALHSSSFSSSSSSSSSFLSPDMFVLEDLLLSRTRERKSGTLSLLGDVTSPTTVAHYVSMTSDLRVLITEKQ